MGKLSSDEIGDLACCVNAIVLQKLLRSYGYPPPQCHLKFIVSSTAMLDPSDEEVEVEYAII